jgi:hypothetical protein
MGLKETGEKTLISSTITNDNGTETILKLIKDEDIGEYYLIESIFGWKQISEIQRNWDLLIKYKYYVKREIAPLIYYILATDPKKFDEIFEFLYNEHYIDYEEDNE